MRTDRQAGHKGMPLSGRRHLTWDHEILINEQPQVLRRVRPLLAKTAQDELRRRAGHGVREGLAVGEDPRRLHRREQVPEQILWRSKRGSIRESRQ